MNTPNKLTPIRQVLGIQGHWEGETIVEHHQLNGADLSKLPMVVTITCKAAPDFQIVIGKDHDGLYLMLEMGLPTGCPDDSDRFFYELFHNTTLAVGSEAGAHGQKVKEVVGLVTPEVAFYIDPKLPGDEIIRTAQKYRRMVIEKAKEVLTGYLNALARM